MSSESEYRDKVYAEAKEMEPTTDALTKFIERRSFEAHDYGTIVYACAATMKAAFRVMNAAPCGGITGFQAGCLMWEMVKEFGMFNEGAPLRIIDFGNLLYPQHDEGFALTLSRESAEALSKKATELLADLREAHPAVVERWEEIAAGEFPKFVTVTDED